MTGKALYFCFIADGGYGTHKEAVLDRSRVIAAKEGRRAN
jgi:hypothetical protein